MNKKVYIIHSWSGSPNEPMHKWLKRELIGKGFEVFVPDIPNSDTPIISERVKFMQKLAPMPDEEIFFIGHSIGCQTIMRYLETLPGNTRVGGAVFIAGWFKMENLEDEEVVSLAGPWMDTPIDFEKIRKICPKISVFLSSDEPYGFVKENKKIFEEKLGAKVTILPNMGHFSEDTGVIELPEALHEFLQIAS